MSTKEKTKADLLTELNEKLEKENEELKKQNDELVDEIRQAKSENANYKGIEEKIKNLESIEQENAKLQNQVHDYNVRNCYQGEQIDALLKGLNNVNDFINKTFANLMFNINLMQEKYDATFNQIKEDLNFASRKYEKYFNNRNKEKEEKEEYKIEESD